MQCLREHGFFLDLRKSKLTPMQHIRHLKMILDTRCMKIVLTKEQIEKVRDLAASVIARSHLHLLILMMFLGLLVANMDTLQWGQLHSRGLQWFLKLYQGPITSRVNVFLQMPLTVRNRTISYNLSKGKANPYRPRGTPGDRHEAFWMRSPLAPQPNPGHR